VPVAVADRLLFVQLPANQFNGQAMNFRYRKQGKMAEPLLRSGHLRDVGAPTHCIKVEVIKPPKVRGLRTR
jgi:hypothetical protein